MTDSDYVPERGDIAWMVLEPRVGHEQSGRRPVIVISAKKLALHTNIAVVCPITSKVIGLPYEIELSQTKTNGVILPFHVRSVDFKNRKAKYIEKAPETITLKAIKGVQNVISED
jgi:mRNA interferase MazF